MTVRVHYHSDCPSFAGCENMLANLLSDAENRRKFDVSLSYRASPEYSAGLSRRVNLDFPVFPLVFPEPSTALPTPSSFPRLSRRVVRFASRQVATYPLLVYEIRLLQRLFVKLAPDIVHINNGGYPAALSARAAAIAARRAGVRHVVMVVNNLAEAHRGGEFSLRSVTDSRVCRAVSRFVTGSVAAADRLQRVLHLSHGQVIAIPNGIALRNSTEGCADTLRRLGISPSDGVLLGVVALMEARKGHRVLLEAVRELSQHREAMAPFTILLEGDGPLRGELERIVGAAGLADRCRFLGPEVNVMNLIAALDVLVLPSVAHEDFPNVVLEAMGLGKAVIASRIAGTPEQIEDGVTGLLVPPGDPRALASAIARMVSDGAMRDAMGRAGRERFEERFTAPTAVRKYADLYQTLIAEGTS